MTEEWKFKTLAEIAASEGDKGSEVEVKPKGPMNARSATWQDADVRAARSTRHHVTVAVHGGIRLFRSVGAAFGHYNLDESKAPRFRVKLKADWTAVYEENGVKYGFSIFDGDKETFKEIPQTERPRDYTSLI